MRLEQFTFKEKGDWENQRGTLGDKLPQLVLVFGDSKLVSQAKYYDKIRSRYPKANIIGCSSSGNIRSNEVLDDCIIITACFFEKAEIKLVSTKFNSTQESYQSGIDLVSQLPFVDLKHVLVLSDGLNINGSELVSGINSVYNNQVSITGGLAGDGTDFSKTWVMANAPAEPNTIAAIGFYGENIKINYGCVHGWENFGVKRTITKSEKNIVYEIDNEPALALYKRYLGPEFSKDLPSSGLRFPLAVYIEENSAPVVRTLLGIDEAKQSLTFAGDLPEGKTALLMKTNLDGLIDAAELAAKRANINDNEEGIAIAISCVGRRLVLNKLTEEEVQVVQDTLGEKIFLTGYYSYGEIAPFSDLIKCQLHNQTMTLTTISE